MKITRHQLRRIIKEATDNEEYQRGYEDGIEGFGLPHDPSPVYRAGWEDGKLDSDYGQMWGGE